MPKSYWQLEAISNNICKKTERYLVLPVAGASRGLQQLLTSSVLAKPSSFLVPQNDHLQHELHSLEEFCLGLLSLSERPTSIHLDMFIHLKVIYKLSVMPTPLAIKDK